MFLRKFSTASNISSDSSISESATIRVVGDRASGKTTYMAALARWPNANSNSPVEAVSSVNDDGQTLISKAQVLLEQGLALEPTSLSQSATTDLPDYAIRITLKGSFSWRNPKVQAGSQPVNLNINCKDYSGEFFRDLVSRAGDPQIKDYMEDCVNANGILLLIDGNAHRRDQDYSNSIDKFLVALDHRGGSAPVKRRIALVLTKCEQPELWVNRHKPREMVQMRFPQIYRRLSAWQGLGAGKVDYFAASALGMLGTNFPAPNATRLSRDSGGVSAVLKDPKRWRPFGLVAPIYWLCTGERHKKLEED